MVWLSKLRADIAKLKLPASVRRLRNLAGKLRRFVIHVQRARPVRIREIQRLKSAQSDAGKTIWNTHDAGNSLEAGFHVARRGYNRAPMKIRTVVVRRMTA